MNISNSTYNFDNLLSTAKAALSKAGGRRLEVRLRADVPGFIMATSLVLAVME